MQLFIVEYEEIGVEGEVYTHSVFADGHDDAQARAYQSFGEDNIRVLSVCAAHMKKNAIVVENA